MSAALLESSLPKERTITATKSTLINLTNAKGTRPVQINVACGSNCNITVKVVGAYDVSHATDKSEIYIVSESAKADDVCIESRADTKDLVSVAESAEKAIVPPTKNIAMFNRRTFRPNSAENTPNTGTAAGIGSGSCEYSMNNALEQESPDDSAEITRMADLSARKCADVSVLGENSLDSSFKTKLYEYTGPKTADGKRHGKGKCVYANTDVYEGDFIGDRRTGRGKYIYANGDWFEGDFVDSVKHGKGKYYFKSTEITSEKGEQVADYYEGDYNRDEQTGRGVYNWINGSKYEGEFVEGRREGSGVFTTNAWTYTGEFANDKRHGRGTMQYSNGIVYCGSFEKDTLHGIGKITWKNGNWFEGRFNLNNLRSGELYLDSTKTLLKAEFQGGDTMNEGFKLYTLKLFKEGVTEEWKFSNGAFIGDAPIKNVKNVKTPVNSSSSTKANDNLDEKVESNSADSSSIANQINTDETASARTLLNAIKVSPVSVGNEITSKFGGGDSDVGGVGGVGKNDSSLFKLSAGTSIFSNNKSFSAASVSSFGGFTRNGSSTVPQLSAGSNLGGGGGGGEGKNGDIFSKGSFKSAPAASSPSEFVMSSVLANKASSVVPNSEGTSAKPVIGQDLSSTPLTVFNSSKTSGSGLWKRDSFTATAAALKSSSNDNSNNINNNSETPVGIEKSLFAKIDVDREAADEADRLIKAKTAEKQALEVSESIDIIPISIRALLPGGDGNAEIPFTLTHGDHVLNDDKWPPLDEQLRIEADQAAQEQEVEKERLAKIVADQAAQEQEVEKERLAKIEADLLEKSQIIAQQKASIFSSTSKSQSAISALPPKPQPFLSLVQGTNAPINPFGNAAAPVLLAKSNGIAVPKASAAQKYTGFTSGQSFEAEINTDSQLSTATTSVPIAPSFSAFNSNTSTTTTTFTAPATLTSATKGSTTATNADGIKLNPWGKPISTPKKGGFGKSADANVLPATSFGSGSLVSGGMFGAASTTLSSTSNSDVDSNATALPPSKMPFAAASIPMTTTESVAFKPLTMSFAQTTNGITAGGGVGLFGSNKFLSEDKKLNFAVPASTPVQTQGGSATPAAATTSGVGLWGNNKTEKGPSVFTAAQGINASSSINTVSFGGGIPSRSIVKAAPQFSNTFDKESHDAASSLARLGLTKTL